MKVQASKMDSESEEDYDVCEDIKKWFAECPCMASVTLKTKNPEYVLQIDGTTQSSPNIALGLSDETCVVYTLTNSHFSPIATFSEHSGKISEVKFSRDNSNLLYTSSNDGTIRLWDLRSPEASTTQYKDTTSSSCKNKTFECIDISPNNKLLTAGTTLVEGDAYLLFWDLRKNELMGGYWESHVNDITQVKFHPDDSNKLISGSTDGLINLYDLSQQNESDALLDSLNTETAIEKISWMYHDNKEIVSCISATDEIQLWKLEDAQPYQHFRRSDVASALKRKAEHIYTINLHDSRQGPFLLAGSNFHDGECVRVTRIGKVLVPEFQLSLNQQRIRSSWFSKNSNMLVTGGEKGILNAWNINFKDL